MSEPAPRLLIIDAQGHSARLLEPHFRGEGAEVFVAGTLDAGLAQALGERLDLILIDADAPAGDVLASAERLQAAPRTAGLPVIVLAASAALDDKLRAFARGAADYIAKPFAPAEVLARAAVQVRIKRRLDRLEAIAASRALAGIGSLANREDDLFAKAAARLEQRLTNPPGLAELARELGTNQRKLTELFRQRLGVTVFDYFAELRLETARRLLEGSRVHIQIIADRVGYSNAGDFTRAFRRRYDLSPRAYRQALATPGQHPASN